MPLWKIIVLHQAERAKCARFPEFVLLLCFNHHFDHQAEAE